MKVSCGCSLYLCFLQYRDNPRMCTSSDCSHSSGVVLTYLSLLLMLSHFVLIKFSQLLPKFTQYVVLSSTTVALLSKAWRRYRGRWHQQNESTTKFSLFSGRVITKLIKIMYKTGHYWGVGGWGKVYIAWSIWHYFYSVQHTKTKFQHFLLSLLTLEKKKIPCMCFWK